MTTAREKLWASGHDESVEVNQRALIDKVLARYSGEFTVFRELLQNSDDAQAKVVEIRFETQAYVDSKLSDHDSEALPRHTNHDSELPDLKTTNVHSWTFKNDGMVFRDEDWSRLKKIAEGNPDEEKIGAFGVGFYSLFSVTEEPFVTSGDQWMGFYWKDKKDQLFARRGHLPKDDSGTKGKIWTSFGMALREPAPIPLAFDFTRFLASSLTFMRTLSEVSVFFDDHQLVKLNKASGLPRDLGLPKGLNCRSPTGIMTVDGIQCTPMYIQARVMRWIYSSGTEKKRPLPKAGAVSKPAGSNFFSSLFSSLSGQATPRVSTPVPHPVVKLVDQRAISETSVSLSIYSASVQVRLTKQLSSEIHRSTKKNPPARTKFELIYTAKDEYDASVEEDGDQPEATGSIFQGLRADIDGIGAARVFIGHSTAQSTGIGGHIAARFIPTVERESIDFVDRNVAVWNKELLYIGGLLSRSTYEFELQTIREQWEASDDDEIRKRLMDRVVHALKFFMFYTSTPSPDVSTLMESAFFACSSADKFPLMSTKGVRNVADIRLPDPAFAGFLKDLPMIPEQIMLYAPGLISALQARGSIRPIKFDDVLKELRARPLDEPEFIACLNWWISIYKETDRVRLLPVRAQIIDAVILASNAENHERIITMASIKSFVNPKSASGSFPADGPFPDSLLPMSISKSFKPELLASCFPWTELTAVGWISFISQSPQLPEDRNMDINPQWAETVIAYITRTWHTITAGSKAEIQQLLKSKTCIPTSAGMKLASEAYFPNVSLFRDLPIVTFPSGLAIKGTLEKVLQELGVRKHVDLQLLFNRMIKTNEWSVADLTKYLASVKDSMTKEEYERLKATSAFLPETSITSDVKPKRYRASQLYEPLDVFRALKLPVIDWGTQTKWKSASEEAKFLFGIGLQRHPSLDTLIHLCASQDTAVQATALKYLIDNLDIKYQDYDPYRFKDVAFIPALKGAISSQGTIQEVYSGPWASVGFMVLQPAYLPYATKLQIKEHPSTSQLIALLESKPPSTAAEARELFRLLAGRVSDFTSSDLQRLSNVAFIPALSGSDTSQITKQWMPPVMCYLGGSSDATFHSKLFTFVNFGQGANAFLAACGSRTQPTVEEIAKILLNDPKYFFELSEGAANYLGELRNLAVNAKMLSYATLQRMKRSSILLGCQRKPRSQPKSDEDLDEDEWDIVYELKKPSEIIIADDTSAYQFFGDKLFTAPQEDIIEGFYAALGSQRLSQIVKEEHKPTVELHDSKLAVDTRALILERLPLFLHEHHAASLAVSFSWISSPKNFVVRAFGKLTMVKHLRYENQHLSRTQDASAVAQKTRHGAIELWIAGNAQVDMYEVATSLNQFIFNSPKANDALLFMTILSTDLRSLKRRGYNVDRILRQQRDAKIATDNARIAREKELKKQHEKETVQQLPPGGFHEPDVHHPTPEPSSQNSAPLPSETNLPPPPEHNITPAREHGPPTPVTPFQNIKHKFGLGSAAAQLEKMSNIVQRNVKSRLEAASTSNEPTHSPSEAGPGVTPLSNISKNIDLAISACRPESGHLVQNREHMERVKESINDGYCDISGRKGNLRNIGQMGSVKIFISEEVTTDPETFMESKHQSIARFIHIMTPLAKIYELPIINLHIFFDLQGGIIAFNKNGSIFLNLRYFEEWHDADVKARRVNEAFISWYFTIAHEIAHNLIQPHNSEHEFYFSAICERHFMKLAHQLNAPPPTSL